MISYQKVCGILETPPPEHLISIYNYLDNIIEKHHLYVAEDTPLKYLSELDTGGNVIPRFCISATSIQSEYIAFVLGKDARVDFPSEIIQEFFNIDAGDAHLQFGNIAGEKVTGCIILLHVSDKNYDLQKVYNNIYDI